MASVTRSRNNLTSQRDTAMLQFALAYSSDQDRLGRLVAEYTDARFHTTNLILAALLRPYEAQDPTTLGTAVFDTALATAMSLSGEIAQVYRDTMDSHVRPTTSSRVAAHVSPRSVVSGILSVQPSEPARQNSTSSAPAAMIPPPSLETPVIWQWCSPGSPNFPAMYRDARTPAAKAAVNRAHHAFVRGL